MQWKLVWRVVWNVQSMVLVWVIFLHLIVLKVEGKNGKNANQLTTHSEQNVIDKYIKLYRRKGYKDDDIRRKLGKQCIIVVRISNDKNVDTIITNSAPCSQCVKCLKKNNIKKIIYSLDDGTLQFSRVRDLDDTHISRGQRAILRKNNAYTNAYAENK